jgi:4-amino-4-deoxy-L-arabinose transferase-like glycosyltransferase
MSDPSMLEGSQLARSADRAPRGFWDEYGLIGMVLVAVFTHAYTMFRYPLYLGDEGIYLEQAWAVIREGQLAPYTYFYDHAPAGWLMIALWEFLLPRHFLTFGMAINSARVFMLLVHAGSAALLYRIAYRFTRGHLGAVAASIAFSVSPLEVYYQRMVLLDNLMVFWVLLALDLLTAESERVIPFLASGLSFGMATLCKENALFFAPVLVYLLYHRVRQTYRQRFAMIGWAVSGTMLISLYPMYAMLKGELLPAGAALVGNGTPGAHVSLISTLLWQLGRHGGSILSADSQFWQYFWGKWWDKDPVIIVIGAASTVLNLLSALHDREQHRNVLIVSLLAIAFTIYLIRGSVMIDFYVVPVLPFFALNVGVLLSRLASTSPRWAGATLAAVALVAMTGAFLAQSHDEYLVDQTRLQADQLAFIRQTIPASATVLIDDDLWVDLHEPVPGVPVYPRAHSHWKIAGDPAIRDVLLRNNWQSLDYLVMSNKLHDIFQLNGEELALTAYDHSRLLARFVEGDVELEVRQVIKPAPTS